jgi:hypothetical protein
MLLSATAAAPLGSFPLRIAGAASIAGKSVSRPGEPILGDKAVKESFLTILDTAAFSLDPVTLSAEVEQNRSGSIEIMVQRREGFTGPIKLSAEGFSAGKDPITKSLDIGEATLKPTESMGKIKLTARQDSEIGTRTILVRGEATVDGQAVVQYSREIPVTITQIPFVLSSTLPRLSVTALPQSSDSAAREASTTVKVERRDGFTNELQVTVEGMPAGIIPTLEKIPANGGETTLKIVATEKAAVGTNSITILGTGLHKDRNYKFRTGAIALVVSAPEPTEQKPPPVIIATNSTNTATAPTVPPTAAAK